ncbi:MAG: hypothetical protein CME07_05515 [Gemmatimonadetes bacterium]|nr:hypothetical protein [Gemmatimonadota bacterium]
MGGVVVLVVGVPLLFSCVWERLRLSEALRERDGLVSRRESMERTLLRLEGARSRLSTWERIAPLADRRLGLSAPAWGDVVWISVSGEAG